MFSPISAITHPQVATPPVAAAKPQTVSAQRPQQAINDTFEPSGFANASTNADQALQLFESRPQTAKESGAAAIQALLAKEIATSKP